jgi:protein TonB
MSDWREKAFWQDKALRPVAIFVAAGLHVLLLTGVALPRPQLASPAENLEISIEPRQGDASPDATQAESADSIAQNEAQPDVKQDPTPEEVKEEPPPEPEKVEEKPQPVAAEAPRRAAADAPEIARRLERQREKKREERIHRRILAQKEAAQSARHARAGVAEGAEHAGLSRATYGSRMLAEIRRHQIHAAGQGSVRVAFTVGGSGHVVGASVTSSSGNDTLDSAALRIVRACHPGPPPGGSFSASATINFR